MSCGQVPEPQTPQDGIAYVALQELATRISHHNTGKLMEDPAGYEVLKRVAADENHHYLFYRDLVTAALEVDPSGMAVAIERQVKEFEMPGTGIVDFTTHAKAIAAAGIYDFEIHHDQILQGGSCCHWGLEGVEGLDDAGKVAQAGAAAPHRAGGQGGQAAGAPARRRAGAGLTLRPAPAGLSGWRGRGRCRGRPRGSRRRRPPAATAGRRAACGMARARRR